MAFQPFEALERWQARYGDVFTLRGLGGQMVVSATTEGAKALFTEDPSSYAPPDDFAMLLGKHSLFVTHGAEHRRDRKLLAPSFSAERMHVYADSIATIAREELGRQVGRDASLKQILEHIAARISTSTVFGVDDEREARRLVGAMSAPITVKGLPLFLFFAPLRHRPFPPWRAFLAARAELDRLLYRLIRARRGASTRGKDILSLLFEAKFDDGGTLSDTQIRDQLITLFLGGHETTVITGTWLIDALFRQPAWSEQVRAELDGLGDDAVALARAPRLDASLSESLRLHPTIPWVSRKLVRPMRFEGHDVPAGSRVAAATWLLHMKAATFPNPRTFDATRFVGRTFRPDQYLPFGGGARRCIGAAYGRFATALIAAVALREFELTPLSSPARFVRTGAVMGPEGAVPVRVRRRRTSPSPDAAVARRNGG